MDLKSLNTNYTDDDFAESLSRLLPPGRYWSDETIDDHQDELTKVLAAIGAELKTTHDTTTLSLLYQIDNIQQGWKLGDYQSLLDSRGKGGTVYDDPAEPNRIMIEFDGDNHLGQLMEYLESYRLPHTAFKWTLKNTNTLHVAAAEKKIAVNRKTENPEFKQLKTGNLHAAAHVYSIVVNRRIYRTT